VPRGVRAGTDAGRTRAAEGHGRRLIFRTQHRTDPISGFANNGDAPVLIVKVSREPRNPIVESGCDGGQLVTGRKRPVVVDTIGCVLVVRVHAANVFDGKAARQVITNLFSSLHTVKKIRGDRAYSGADLFNWVLTPFECQREVVRKKKRTARFLRFTSPLGGRKNIRLAESMASIE